MPLRLDEVFELPDAMGGVSQTVGDFSDKLGVESVSLSSDGSETPLDDYEAVPTDDEDAYLASQVWYEDDFADQYGNADEPGSPGDTTAVPDTWESLVTAGLRCLSDISLSVPGIDGVSLVIGSQPCQLTYRQGRDDFRLELSLAAAIRFAAQDFPPVLVSEGVVTPDPDRTFTDIQIGSATLSISSSGELDLDVGQTPCRLQKPIRIGNSGIVIESAALAFNLSGRGTARPAGTSSGWRGVMLTQARLRMPDVFNGYFEVDGFGIGDGGLSGSVTLGSDDRGSPIWQGTALGMEAGISRVSLTLLQNSVTQGSIAARVKVPLFGLSDAIDIDIGISSNGDVSATLSNAQGGISLSSPDIGTLALKSLTVGRQAGLLFTSLSGTLTPSAFDIDWPSFEISDLRIDEHGHVSFGGGWIDLPGQKTVDLYGFHLEVTKLGFGQTGTRKWIGFSGGLKLVDGLSAGASVEGLRILWEVDDPSDVSLTLNGVGVSMEIPNALTLDAKVSLEEHGFKGAGKLVLQSIGLEVDARVVVGNEPGVGRYLGVYLDAELPAGIPLFSTGLAIYGFAGVFAYQFEPKKQAKQNWYDWYRSGTPGIGFYEKWQPVKDSIAFGAGITLGTVSDNGYAFNGRFLLLIVLPGPILMIEGRASMCKSRGKLSNEGNFRALAVLDRRAGTFQIGLDAQYKYGSFLDIGGSAEAFFNFNDATDWHVWIGQKERAKRIRANLFKLFEVNAYFMLDAHKIDTGSGWSYGKSWKFGPFRVGLKASLDEEAVISWQPAHFTGTMDMEGKAELKAFGRGVSLNANAGILVDVFDPYKIRGQFKVRMDLPWPLPDLSKTVTLEWKKSQNTPSLPQSVQEVAIEHLKTTTKWPVKETLVDAGSTPPDDSLMPVIPVDSNIGVAFARPVVDATGAGENATGKSGGEWIGNPTGGKGVDKVTYALQTVSLEMWVPGQNVWREVAKSGAKPKDATETATLHGMWANVPPQTHENGVAIAQTKLMIGSRTPFDYAGHSSDSWDEWFSAANPNYPCVDEPAPWSQLFDEVETKSDSWLCPDLPPNVTVHWIYGGSVMELEEPIDGIEMGLESQAASDLIHLPQFALDLEPAWAINQLDVLVGYPEPGEGPELPAFSFYETKPGEYDNPHVFVGDYVRSPTFTTYQEGGAPNAKVYVVDENTIGRKGIVLKAAARLDFFAPAKYVSMELYSPAGNLTVEVFDAQDRRLDSVIVPPGLKDGDLQQVSFVATDMAWARVTQERADVSAVLVTIAVDCPIQAWGIDRDGTEHGPFEPEDHNLHITGTALAKVRINSNRPAILARVDLDRQTGEAIRHTLQSTELFKQTADILEPNQKYRLKLGTLTSEQRYEPANSGKKDPKAASATKGLCAYFRTAGPPAIVPPSKPKLATGQVEIPELQDLTIYVASTSPVSQDGGKPKLSRHYRGYDVGIEFNEAYVELMYRAGRRDLRLCLFDGGNERADSGQGWLTEPASAWTKVDEVRVTETVARWIATVNRATCNQQPKVHEGDVVKNDALRAAARILKPKMLYEARLLPLLLHETFGPLGQVLMEREATVVASQIYQRWEIAEGADKAWKVDFEDVTLPSPTDPNASTKVRSYFLTNTKDDTQSSLRYRGLESKPGDNPSVWTDVRLRVTVKWATGQFGIGFRQSGGDNYDAFWADQSTGERKLVSVRSGHETTVASDTTTFDSSMDVVFAIELIGKRVRAWQDDQPIFDTELADVQPGTIRLFAKGTVVKDTPPLHISDLTVEDLRETATVAYRFPFTTSAFASFVHQVQSGQDLLATMDIPTSVSDSDLAQWLGTHADPEAEARDWDGLAKKLFPGGIMNPVDGLQVTGLRRDGHLCALFVQSPEPIDWSRASVTIGHSDTSRPAAAPPGDVKVVAVAFSSDPAAEKVDLVLRGKRNLTGYRIEYRAWPASQDDPWTEYYAFEAETALSDGALVRVASAAPGSGSTRFEERFVAEAGEGTAHFSGTVELRVLAPSGQVVHQRAFSDGSDVSALDVHYLRSRDGTAFLVIPAKEGDSLGTLPSGQLQCQLVFALAGPNLPTLRFAGSTTAESAVIDVTIP